jgi:mRNA-degrading endonuclease RelE of RelBE toxin-antitoxin system
MSSADGPSITIRYTSEFKRNLRVLSKKYRHIRQDIQSVIDDLQQSKIIGDQVPGVGYTIYKVRVRNTDARKGKRGGYRVIYYLQTKTDIILITIYSKTEQSDISDTRIQQIIKSLE